MKKKLILISTVLLTTSLIISTVVNASENTSSTEDLSTYTTEPVETVQETSLDTESVVDENIILEDISPSEATQDDIFYKMLNAIDYYTQVSGKIIDAEGNINTPITIEFQSNLEDVSAYSTYSVSDLTSRTNSIIQDKEYYIENGVRTELDNINDTYLQDCDVLTPDENLPLVYSREMTNDNRITVDEEGIKCYQYRCNITNVHGASICIFPQEMAFGFLEDKSLWSIKETTTYLNRQCWSIEGQTEPDYGDKLGVNTFTFLVDTQTGVLLKYEGFDDDGNLSDYMYAENINFDNSAEDVQTLSDSALEQYESR